MNCANKVSLVLYTYIWSTISKPFFIGIIKWICKALFFCTFGHHFHCSAMLLDRVMGTNWVCYGWILKVAKAHVQTRFKRILAHASKTTLKTKWAYSNFWKSTFSHSMTHNSANQHCIATEVSNSSNKLIWFWNTLPGFDIFD